VRGGGGVRRVIGWGKHIFTLITQHFLHFLLASFQEAFVSHTPNVGGLLDSTCGMLLAQNSAESIAPFTKI
jgi:hypothetical protein